MKQKSKNILLVVTVVTVIIVVFGATYAYFMAQTGAGQSANINVSANTTDSLMFEVGKDLNLNVTQANFGEGAGNQSDSTTAKAILMANNQTNTARYTYNLYLNITKNEFVYTTEEQTPEIILQITKPDGTTLTSLEGLNYVTVGSASGFDITMKNGPITIADSRLIEVLESNTNHKTEEEWQIGITFINLDSNQQENTNKSFVSKVIIQKEELSPILAKHIISTYGTDRTLYYHDSNLANGANDNSYRYAGPHDSVNNFVCFGSEANECPNDNLYRIIGIFDNKVKLIKYDYVTTSLLGTDGDNGDAYGVTTRDMTDEYLVKQGYKGTLKASEIGLYMYNYNGLSNHEGDNQYGSNEWSTSLLNTVNLNTNFLNNIGSAWSSKIAMTTWYIGGISYSDLPFLVNQKVEVAKEFYGGERNKDKTYDAKVGLMYPSEFLYAGSKEYWSNLIPVGDNENYLEAREQNWMQMKMVYEWTLSPNLDEYVFVLTAGIFGIMNDSNFPSFGLPVRPTFSLNSDVVLLSGDGTKNSPYRIN